MPGVAGGGGEGGLVQRCVTDKSWVRRFVVWAKGGGGGGQEGVQARA